MAINEKIIWRIVDGKSGHENQSSGLADALQEYVPARVINIKHQSKYQSLVSFIFKIFPLSKKGKPDLIIGAGHRTHMSLLAAKRTWRAPAVVLMNPSLPRRLFDMCIIPEHDGVKASARNLLTHGVLNSIKPSADRQPGTGLILLGGVSKHAPWSDDYVFEQVQKIVNASDVYFTLVTSRRTPKSFIDKLLTAKLYVGLVLVEDAEPGWLATQMPLNETIWITEDSVSMVYEALSSGASCGVMQICAERDSKIKNSRVLSGLEKLKREKLLTAFTDWNAGQILKPPPELLAEASRCAKVIAEKWLIKN